MTFSLSPVHRLIGDVFALIYRGAPNYEAHLWPDATLAMSGDIGAYWLNTVVIGDGPNAEDHLRHATTILRERSLPCWVMYDDSLNSRLAPIIQDAGLQDLGTAPLMVYHRTSHSLDLASDDRYRIERVVDEPGFRDANRITAAAFETPVEVVDRVWTPMLLEMPGLDFFLARRDGTVISVVLTVRHGPVIGIWAMGTLPEHQRQGAGRQVLDTALRHHLQLGAQSFYLVAFEAGKRLYDQTGFQTAGEIRLWITPDAGTH